MNILAIRTDKPEAELYLLKDNKIVVEIKWEAHRKLAETLHLKIQMLLEQRSMSLKDIDKIVAYSGPGSFTGLRIGVSVANALSYSLGIPIIGKSGEKWLENAVDPDAVGFHQVVPFYGSDPHITQPKK